MCQFCLVRFREWMKQLRHCQDWVFSKEVFQNSPTHKNVKMMFYRTIYYYGCFSYRYIYRYLYCQTKLGYRVFLKLRNNFDANRQTKLSLNPISISVLEVLKTRSRISKLTFITLTCGSVKCLLMVSLIRCQHRRVIVVLAKEIKSVFS